MQFAEGFIFFLLSALFEGSLEVWCLWGEKKNPSGCVSLCTPAPQGSVRMLRVPAEHVPAVRAAQTCPDTRLGPGQPPAVTRARSAPVLARRATINLERFPFLRGSLGAGLRDQRLCLRAD